MYFIRIDPTTHRILGRAREKSDENCIEVSEDLFGRIIGASQAFEFVPETGTIELRDDYQPEPQQDIDQPSLEQYVTGIQQQIHVPELGIEVSIGGAFGRVLLFAMSCAAFAPQTILCTTGGKFTHVEIDAEAATHIARAFNTHSLSLLGIAESGEPDE